MRNTKTWTKLVVLAGIAVMSVAAHAVMDDATILIDKAIDSPNLTVKYNGAAAAMAELKVNGTSFSTKNLTPTQKKGEISFSLDLSLLRDGENEVEIRLLDKDGKLLGTQKSTVTTNQGERGPVFLLNPKVGATVNGVVEIKVGFGRELRNKYVSFFINSQFKSMSNMAPFTFTWDTTLLPNGWHEIEAWVVDDGSDTFKSRKVKVFVNNPGGRTERILPNTATTAKPPVIDTPPVKPPVTNITVPKTNAIPEVPKVNVNVSGATGIKTASLPQTSGVTTAINNSIPQIILGLVQNNGITGAVKGAMDVRAAVTIEAIQMGPKASLPALPGIQKPVTQKATEIKVNTPPIVPVKAAAGLIPVTYGKKLKHVGSFSIMFNAAPIVFDVSPRVQDGIPLTPFRHLLEHAGGEIKWENLSKSLTATEGGRDIYIRIGDKLAKINKIDVEMEIAPFLERGRTMVPLSFIRQSLEVDVDYDPVTGHVLITKKKS